MNYPHAQNYRISIKRKAGAEWEYIKTKAILSIGDGIPMITKWG